MKKASFKQFENMQKQMQAINNQTYKGHHYPGQKYDQHTSVSCGT